MLSDPFTCNSGSDFARTASCAPKEARCRDKLVPEAPNVIREFDYGELRFAACFMAPCRPAHHLRKERIAQRWTAEEDCPHLWHVKAVG